MMSSMQKLNRVKKASRVDLIGGLKMYWANIGSDSAVTSCDGEGQNVGGWSHGLDRAQTRTFCCRTATTRLYIVPP